ncbi:hypothetical protein GOP47_0020674 [Adiantum capillus-veneris]|uniref:Uncharacterized protein n=1 Tax=Adiantum capillus-veneris TaxID=13818 RepID=A0A9D4UB75_ADICA|nr:hypothetical protein GOP47_0020674 [Adiantum capillus-veneris]
MASSSLMCCSSKIVPARDLSSASSSVFVSSPSTLPLTCGYPTPKPASKLVITTKCGLSDEEQQTPSAMGRRVLAGVVATGAALAVFTNMAIAAQGPGNEGARRTAEKADSLLKAADKLNNEDAPPRFGPGRPGGAQDPTKISQIAGSGPAGSVQKGASKAAKGVGDATKSLKSKGDGLFGFGKKESGAVANNATDALSQAKGKTEEVASNVKQTVIRDGFGRVRGPAKDLASNVEGAVGQAQNKKAGNFTNAAKDAIGQAQSKTNIGNSGGSVLSSLQEGLQGLREGVAQSGSDAKDAVTGTLEQTVQ